MKGKNHITINGRSYDALTGMPLPDVTPHAPRTAHAKLAPQQQPTSRRTFSDISVPSAAAARPVQQPAKPVRTLSRSVVHHAVHKQPQKSQTLYRAALKPPHAKPVAKKPTVHRSPVISKFGSLYDTSSQPASPTPSEQVEPAAAPQQPGVHPAVAKALATMQQPHAQAQAPAKPQPVHSSKELKQMLIKERLAEVDAGEKTAKKQKLGFFKRQPRLTAVLTSTLAVLLLGGYLTYINLPNISMRVAATRAGVNAASFPSYNPDGYSFHGPITYAPGEIMINFKSNTNPQSYTVKQKTSNWDSQAVLDNYVLQQTDSYLTYQEQGLTIYSFSNKAAWVNGGLLYSIEGNAQLSSDQVLRIATSM